MSGVVVGIDLDQAVTTVERLGGAANQDTVHALLAIERGIAEAAKRDAPSTPADD